MFHASHHPIRSIWLACCALLVVGAATPATAAVVNKYTFNNGDIVDSVGGQNGTLIDNTGIATFTGGALNLSANNGAGSNQDFSLGTTVGAFVDLPNFLLNNAVNNGVFGQASVETWFTVQEYRNWSEVWSFGDQGNDASEGLSNGGEGQNYVALIPRSGANPNDFRATTRNASNAESPIIGSPSEPLPLNQRQHVVVTFDLFDTTAGPGGTAKMYLNNGTPSSAEIFPLLDLVSDVNNWLGRSPWPDPLFDGLIDEFRIHDSSMSDAEVSASFTTGPEPAALPVLIVNRDTGAISISNPSGSGITLKGYSISSTAGSLDPAAWTSIDAGNLFDPNGTWTAQSSTTTNLAESVTGGTLDGGLLAASASRGIGLPWEKTPFEDLTFDFTLGDDSVGSGTVQYTGTAVSRSDLNGDGAINVADWAVFVPNSFKSFTGETAVAAYLKGDLDGDLDNDYNDYRLFKADFIAANGVAAFNALGIVVPEPGSLTLIGLACLSLAGYRRR